MPPQTWIRGRICGVDNCRLRRYLHSDGQTICQYGHVVEGEFEFNNEEDGEVANTRRITVLGVNDQGSFRRSQRRTTNDDDALRNQGLLHGQEAFELYMRCLQILLQRQIDNFVELFLLQEVKQEFTAAVKRNWITLVQFSYRFYHYRNSGNQKALLALVRGCTNRAAKSVEAFDIVTLMYLTCLEIECGPVYLIDIVAALDTYQIPFINVLDLGFVPASLYKRLPMGLRRFLQPLQLPKRESLVHNCRLLGGRIWSGDLKVSEQYYYPFAFRTVINLGLDPRVFDLYVVVSRALSRFHEVLYCKTHTGMAPWRLYFPELRVALLITCLGMFFIESNSFNLNAWKRAFSSTLALPLSQEDYEDVLNWDTAKTEAYCNWITSTLIEPKLLADNKTTTMTKRLFRIFDPTFSQRTIVHNPTPQAAQRVKDKSEIKELLVKRLAQQLLFGEELVARVVNITSVEVLKYVRSLKPGGANHPGPPFNNPRS